ncbi:MAG: aminopeptidase P N-terminal domain-containing protein [Clostridiales bacterium]|jgi:Xaa-Pro aminopeptidase|nr:aminopeptidase P N-terminal domain-containing protein [Clostridiales bacterium]
MDASFHRANRQKLLDMLPDGAIAVLFAGKAPRMSADSYYPFFASRNYLYLAGVDFEGFILVLRKYGQAERESLYILPREPMRERWTGSRYSAEDASRLSGVGDIRYVGAFADDLQKEARSGEARELWLELYKHSPDEPDDCAHLLAAGARRQFPWLGVGNLQFYLRGLRTIKAPCEIAAMRRAMAVTRQGILAMMRASRPGMYEYEYKAEYDYALMKNGVLSPGFPPIISAGRNNFCIHYYSYAGQAMDGDMILNDVGARWDNEVNDVSRGWPCNGSFTKEQAALYTAALNTSNRLFAAIRPGMPMADVDETVRRSCFAELKQLGLLQSYDDIGRYVWHGGAHHIGYDVHDTVDSGIQSQAMRPGMVFCVDVGIYCEEWGIGFRLEDNCLVTEQGCENLSAGIPRSIAEIESAIGGADL